MVTITMAVAFIKFLPLLYSGFKKVSKYLLM